MLFGWFTLLEQLSIESLIVQVFPLLLPLFLLLKPVVRRELRMISQDSVVFLENSILEILVNRHGVAWISPVVERSTSHGSVGVGIEGYILPGEGRM